MPDILREKASAPVQIVGGGTDEETNIAKISTLKELQNADTLNNGGADIVLTVTTSPVEAKVGVNRKVDRKYLIIEALDTNVKMGFSSGTQNIPIFKSQIIMIPVGENTQVWFKADSGTRTVALGEF
jgi:hypothetical protein